MSWIRSHLKLVLPLAGALLVGVGYLAFAVFGVHTLFIDDRVDETGPVFASGAAADESTSTEPGTTEPPTSEPPTSEPPTSEAPTSEAPTSEPPTAEAASGELQPGESASSDPAAPTVPAAPVTTVPPEPEIVTLVEGTFIPRGRYSGEGSALVLNDGSEQRFLRFENFSTDNGPDLNVYLVNSDADADQGTFDDDFIDLGNLKGNIGDQNYEIPTEVDLAVYDTVVVWCVRFGTAFTAADLVAA